MISPDGWVWGNILYEKAGLPDPDTYEGRCQYYLFMEIKRRRMQIELETIATLRRAVLDVDAKTPDSSTFRQLMASMFPYLGMMKDQAAERAKEIMKEDLEGLLIVTPVPTKKLKPPVSSKRRSAIPAAAPTIKTAPTTPAGSSTGSRRLPRR